MRDDIKYLESHHHATETFIGLARLHLKNDDPERALAALDTCCERLRAITIKYQPASAKFQGLINERGE